MRRILLLLVPLSLVVAACGDDDAAHGDVHGDDSEVAEGARTVEVEASSFSFDPGTIEVEVGEDVAISLRSADVEHDFVIDELDAHVKAGPRQRATGGFNAGDEPGTYTYYCSVAGHREAGMEGELVVR